MRTVVGRGALTESVIQNSEPQAPQSGGKAAAYVASQSVKQKRETKPRDIIVRTKRNKATKAGVTAAEFDEQKRKKLILISAIIVAAILIVGIVLIVTLSTCGKNVDKGVFTNRYSTTTKVGASAEYLGTTERKIPTEIRDEGLQSGYPKYGYSLNAVLGAGDDKAAARRALIDESDYLTGYGTSNNSGNGDNGEGTYTWMDKNGNLYSGSVSDPVAALDANGVPRKLYKHTASVGLYLGDVADDEPGIVKKLTFSPRAYTGYYDVTGVYAPAGEVIKVQISQEDMKATGVIVVHIGQALYNGQSNNIWVEKNQMNRFPNILNTLALTESTMTLGQDGMYTGYIGSFLGGPIYVRDERVAFSVTISGGVRYSHFILGYTTPEEFEQNKSSSAPYFDLEVWDNGVLHSGPKFYAQSFSYDDLYDAAVLWDKISLVSTQVSTQGIVFLYDSFVAAGAAVAFPGRQSVNCPMGWMPGSLNYKSFVKGGAWGNMHEYNHNFQGWGRGVGGEVTNNALNLIEYSLFTKISSARGIGGYGAAGLSGWNCYTSPAWALSQSIGYNGLSTQNDLSNYAAVLHNLGQDMFIKSIRQQRAGRYGESVTGWCRALSEITHQDMTYFFNDLVAIYKGNSQYNVTDEWVNNIKANNYPVFVPVASVYQTGRSFMYDGEKRYITTAQPYTIQYDAPFEFDLGKYTAPSGMYESGSVVIPDGFKYVVKNVSQPEYGKIEKIDELHYKYTPDPAHMRSGEIKVTLGVAKNDGAFSVDDIDLVLEFEQTHEMNKLMLERTTYKYNEGELPESATAAFESGYAGNIGKTESDNVNRMQNCNTDIWYTNQEGDDVPLNSVVELRGKIHVDEAAKYRIALRGRWNCALYISTDNENYELAASYVQTGSSNYTFPNTVGTYRDLNLAADSWLYFKAVLVTGQNGGRASFIGVGWGKFTYAGGIIDENGNFSGNTVETVSVGYASAYRTSYEFPTSEFESDYFYTREYKYDYVDSKRANEKQTILSSKYTPYNANRDKLENLVDGNTGTYIHTGGGVSDTNPFEVVVDMGESKPANRMTLSTQYRPNGDYMAPTSFGLYGSDDGENFFTVGEFADVLRNGLLVTVDFEEKSFRYYKLIVTKSTGGYLIITEISLVRNFEVLGGKQYSPDDKMLSFKNGWSAGQTQSTFGHVNVGKKGASLEFEFTGKRVAIFSRNAFATSSFDVYIDGVKATGIALNGDGFDPIFMSGELSEGKHKVTVKCKTSNSDIDSVVIW